MKDNKSQILEVKVRNQKDEKQTTF
jgi:hypothetical protein